MKMRNSPIDSDFKGANAYGNGQPWHTHYPLTGGHVTALGMPGFFIFRKVDRGQAENEFPVIFLLGKIIKG